MNKRSPGRVIHLDGKVRDGAPACDGAIRGHVAGLSHVMDATGRRGLRIS